VKELRLLRLDALKRGNFICGTCKVEKNQENFSSNAAKTTLGFGSICKSCLKERERFSKVKIKYGLNKQEFIDKFNNINNSCEICKIRLNIHSEKRNITNTLNVDHCHITGKTRGFLCSNCNRALGLFKDDVEILKSAKQYLVQYKLGELLENPGVDNQQPI